MDENLAYYALERARSDYAEVRMEKMRGAQVVIKNGNLEIFQVDSSYGLSVRVLADGGLGFASTNILTKESVAKAVSKATSNQSTSAVEKLNIIMESDINIDAFTLTAIASVIYNIPKEELLDNLLVKRSEGKIKVNDLRG